MKYHKLSRVASLLAFCCMFAQLYAVASAAGPRRPEPGAVSVEAGLFSAGVIFSDLCACGKSAAVPVGGERPSQQ